MKMGIPVNKQCPDFDDASGVIDDILLHRNKGEYFMQAEINNGASNLAILPKQKQVKDDLVFQTRNLESELALRISTTNQPIDEAGSQTVLLEIVNVSDKLIPNIYGKIILSKTQPDSSGRYSPIEPVVPLQYNLAWQGNQFLKALSVKSPCYLIIAEKLQQCPGFTIFFETSEGRKETNMLGDLLLDIEIGSETDGFIPNCASQAVLGNWNFIRSRISRNKFTNQMGAIKWLAFSNKKKYSMPILQGY